VLSSRRRLRAHHHERACGSASRAGDRSLVHDNCGASARTTVRHHKHLVFIAPASASCRLTVGARDPHRAFAGGRASRSGRTLLALRAGRSWWASRSRRTGLAPFTWRPSRAGFSLWTLSAPRCGNGNRKCNRDTFHLHAHTFCIFKRPHNISPQSACGTNPGI
jgi:hypothetical protein